MTPEDQGSSVTSPAPEGRQPAPATAHFERGYVGHGHGVVVTNDGRGNFSERPMSEAELAARAPALLIGADPYKFAAAGAFAYYRCWQIISAAIESAVAERDVEIRRLRVTLRAVKALAQREANPDADDLLVMVNAALAGTAVPDTVAGRRNRAAEDR